MGSQLLLKPAGTFEYMLAYGAADYGAPGKWSVDGVTRGARLAEYRSALRRRQGPHGLGRRGDVPAVEGESGPLCDPVCRFEGEPLDVNPEHNDFVFEINGEAITQVAFALLESRPGDGLQQRVTAARRRAGAVK